MLSEIPPMSQSVADRFTWKVWESMGTIDDLSIDGFMLGSMLKSIRQCIHLLHKKRARLEQKDGSGRTPMQLLGEIGAVT